MTQNVPWQLQVFAVSVRKKEKWRWAKPHLKPSRRCLDIGSGVGTLSVLMERLGGSWEFTETDSAAAQETQSIVKGPVYQVDIFDQQLKPNTYDLVTIFDVIEHVEDPKTFMQRAQELLKPGGTLILTTPADDGSFYFWRRLAEKLFGIDKAAHGHIVEGFSRKQLEQLTKNANLELTRLDPFSYTFTECIELLYNGAYILKNKAKQTTGGYNLALSPANAGDVTRHRAQLKILKIVYPLLRAISLLDHIIPIGKHYEWGLVARK